VGEACNWLVNVGHYIVVRHDRWKELSMNNCGQKIP